MESMPVPANPPLARKRMVRPVEDFGGFGLYPPAEGAWDGCHTEDMTEEEYREWLDRTFRPLFEPYEGQGGVPCRQLLTHFQYEDQGLPRERRIELVLKMDKNRDGRITFEEFRSTLVKIRYKDLPPVKRFGLRAVLAGNPGMRLSAAKVQAADHLRNIESLGRSGVFVQEVPDPVSGGFPNSKAAGGFYLEPDGVWPTSMQKGPPTVRNEQIASRKTITDEVYVPQSYLEAYNCRPPPIFIPLIVLAQIGVFIYYAVELNKRAVSEPLNQLTMISGFPYFSPLYFDPRRRREVWRFLSYFLVHQGIWHLLFNCIATLIFGLLIEWVHKFWRVAPVYLTGVLAGSLISSVLDPFAILAGSSGGAYALIGSHLALIVMNWEELQHDVTTCRYGFLGFISSGVFRLCLILIFVGTDFGLALYRRYGLQADVSVSISAHLGGFLAGLLVGIPVLRNLHEKPWERIVFWISMAILVAFFVFAIFWNIFWTGYPTQLV
nr:unnamed protein product [Spirometra erinaceieuropaei]